MTTSIRSLGISFDLERHRTLRGKDDVRHTLAKSSNESHSDLQISTLPDRFRPVRTLLLNFQPRI